MSTEKRCTRCGTTKVLGEFTKNRRASLGVNNWCKKCYAAYSRHYYDKTRDRRKKLARERRAENAEKYNARTREWREANPDYYRERYLANREKFMRVARTNYWKDPEKNVRMAVEWAKQNPGKVNAIQARRNAKKKNAPGRGVSGGQWMRTRRSTLGVCSYCSTPTDRIEMDHIVPLAGGGAHDVSNLAPVCKTCNCSKKDTALLVWWARRVAA